MNPRYMKMIMDGKVEDPYKKHFVVGSALDCLLTSPERWEDDFEVIEATLPTGNLGKFVHALPEGLTIFSPLEDYLEAYEASGYKRGIDWAVANFWATKDAVDYYNAKYLVSTKMILTKDIMEQVNTARELLVANP